MGVDDRAYILERTRKRKAAENARANGFGWGVALWLTSVVAAFYCGVLYQFSHADAGKSVSAASAVDPSGDHHLLERFTGTLLVNPLGIETAPAVPFPANGSLYLYNAPVDEGAELTIVSNKSHPETSYFVRVSDWSTRAPVLDIFVLGGGHAAKTLLPFGTYRITYAGGKTWYGTKTLFGRGMAMSEGLSPTQLYRSGPNQTTGAIITLENQINGNFPTRPAPRNAFD